MIDNIIWDFDGTLFNTYPVMTMALQKALKEKGVDEYFGHVYSQLKISLKHAASYYREKYHIMDNLKELCRIYEQSFPERIQKPFPHTRKICQALRARRRKNFLLTHREKESTMKLLNYHGFTEYFDEIITEDCGFKRKPDGESFIYLVEKYNLSKERTLGVGDRDIDILAAKAAGIKTCYFSQDASPCPVEADFVINDMSQLYKMINKKPSIILG